MADLITRVDPELLDRVRTVREQLHAWPELSFEEERTARTLMARLEGMPLDGLLTGVGGHGLVAWVGRPGGRTVALRAEMDGLPIEETTGLAYASRNPGRMHACGHDGHMAIALGVLEMFCARRARLPGTLKVIFQPGEEEGAGARGVVEAGALYAPDVDAIFGLHARPQLASGQIELAEIPSAAADAFDVGLVGTTSHGAYPHAGRDALWAACQAVVGLQQVVARQVPARHQAVVTVGAMGAGQARNVIAGRAWLKGTIRTRDPEVRRQVIASVERVVRHTGAAAGCAVSFELQVGYPRVRNDPGLCDLVRRVGRAVLGADGVLEAKDATMGADDFSFYLSEQGGVPGCMIRLGVESDQPLHGDRFDFGVQALEPGILILANSCLAYLAGQEAV